MKATVINAWQDATTAYLAVEVDEGNTMGTVEYIGNVPLDQEMTPATDDAPAVLFRDLSADAQQRALIDAVKAIRDRQVAPVETIAMPKTVTL